MSPTVESGTQFDIYTDESSVRRAAERIRAGIGLVGFSRPSWKTRTDHERRSEPRHPLVAGAFLMPVRVEGGQAQQLNPDEPLVPVVTLNMSPRGVGVQHQEPIPEKTCILIFDLWSDDPITLLVNHRWFRQESGDSCFRSGFAILGVVQERSPQSSADAS